MSAANPSKAIAAMLPAPIDCGYGVHVLPLSLAHYAILERIGSSLVAAEPKKVPPLELIPSLYVVTRPAAETMEVIEDLSERAMAWAATLPPSIMPTITAAVTKQIMLMMGVVPQPEDAKKKAGTTAGSRRSRTGR